MTTINLTPDQEEVLRRWQGADPSRLTDELRVIAQLAERLPPPPYVPAVGDRVRVLEGNTVRSYERGETVHAVDDTYVLTIEDDADGDCRPEVYAYRIDGHRFEKVEQ